MVLRGFGILRAGLIMTIITQSVEESELTKVKGTATCMVGGDCKVIVIVLVVFGTELTTVLA